MTDTSRSHAPPSFFGSVPLALPLAWGQRCNAAVQEPGARRSSSRCSTLRITSANYYKLAALDPKEKTAMLRRRRPLYTATRDGRRAGIFSAQLRGLALLLALGSIGATTPGASAVQVP